MGWARWQVQCEGWPAVVAMYGWAGIFLEQAPRSRPVSTLKRLLITERPKSQDTSVVVARTGDRTRSAAALGRIKDVAQGMKHRVNLSKVLLGRTYRDP